jgi:Fe-S-cluster-containing dehydrogenase component
VFENETDLPAQWRSLNPAPFDPNAPMPSQMGGVNRREFLSLMAASMALAGVAGCSASASLPEKIVPYVRPPEELLPGIPLYFATAMPFAGYGIGLIVKSHEGRPTKIEGNPRHPASLGATDVFAQASILDLYDPDRAKTATHHGAISTSGAFVTAISSDLERFKASGGEGLRFLSGVVTSPSETALIQQILKTFPGARWHTYEPVHSDNVRAGSRMAFGKYLDTIYRFDLADTIVSLDADFLAAGPARLRYTRDFADRRVQAPDGTSMNRLYAFESTPGITGAKADHRVALRASEITNLAQTIASRLGLGGSAGDIGNEYWFEPMIRDIDSHRGSTIITAGPTQPAVVHALVHAINEKLGNTNKTVIYVDPVESQPAEQADSLRELVHDMRDGKVDSLVVLDANPVYNAPADLEFSKSLSRVRQKVSYSLYFDETAANCDWHIPCHHYLEAWGDVRAYDGTVSIIQPLIVPLYQSKSRQEFLSIFLGQPARSNYEIVRDFWNKSYEGEDFEGFWEQVLQDGIVSDSQRPAVRPIVDLKSSTINAIDQSVTAGGIEIQFRQDPSLYDGSFANNVWLQELPHPMTKLTWDNAVMLSPRTAGTLQVGNEDKVNVDLDGRQITGAVWIVPGHPDDSASMHLGWGRRRAGTHGTERGFSAYELRTMSAPWNAAGGGIRKAGGKYQLVSTQDHHGLHGRHMVRHLSASEYEQDPGAVRDQTEVPAPDDTMYPRYSNVDYAWGMSVDLSRCVGCNACVTACQAENNIPVVGKNEVSRAREMHWMRIDSYYEGSPENPSIYFQPMFCQHCETAPCELVCPVEATTHSAEGINEMTYNRCVGTRYCSNNCPYKVRRFNFFQYTVWDVPSLKLLYNPDVTVRSRGVMEKCTYCIQRINRSRINALKEDRLIRDGEMVTACQQACPANALVFGNLLDHNSRVVNLKAEPRDYSVLADYNTRPRTTYLAALKNPNPDIEGLETARRQNHG